jgi:hypothetical protein
MNNAPAQTRHSLLASAALGRSQCRLEARGTGDGRHDPVGRALRRFDNCISASARFDARAGQLGLQLAVQSRIGDGGKARAKLARELRKRSSVAMCSDSLDPIELGILTQQIDGA